MLLASPDISKDDLIGIITKQVIDQNPEDKRVVGRDQMMLHPGLVVELRRLTDRLEDMSAEELRVILIRGNFAHCEG